MCGGTRTFCVNPTQVIHLQSSEVMGDRVFYLLFSHQRIWVIIYLKVCGYDGFQLKVFMPSFFGRWRLRTAVWQEKLSPDSNGWYRDAPHLFSSVCLRLCGCSFYIFYCLLNIASGWPVRFSFGAVCLRSRTSGNNLVLTIAGDALSAWIISPWKAPKEFPFHYLTADHGISFEH